LNNDDILGTIFKFNLKYVKYSSRNIFSYASVARSAEFEALSASGGSPQKRAAGLGKPGGREKSIRCQIGGGRQRMCSYLNNIITGFRIAGALAM